MESFNDPPAVNHPTAKAGGFQEKQDSDEFNAMTLRARLKVLLKNIRRYAVKQHSYASRHRTECNAVWLEAEAKGQCSAVKEVDDFLRRSDPDKDCQPEAEDRDP